jgi:hypothetical protein
LAEQSEEMRQEEVYKLSEQANNEKEDRKQKIIQSVVGTIVLGALGSGLWELFAKPGLSRLGRSILTTLTLGSERVRDLAYASAALDPYPLPALIIFYLLAFIPLHFALKDFLDEYLKLPLRQKLIKAYEQAKNSAEGDAVPLKEWIRPKRRKLFWAMMLGYLLVVVYSLVGVNIINQAIVIRRTFTANLAICSPYISYVEEKRFIARFAAVQARSEYIPINNDLQKIAVINKTKLLKIDLW